MGRRQSDMGDKASILLVDDNINLIKTMVFIIKRKGYEVFNAKDGLEAIKHVKERSFGIIFMDIKMLIMDGVETFKKIKQINPESIVMMMTAYAVEDLVQEALEEGAYGIIFKPLDIERVINLIQEAREKDQGALILVVDDDPGTYKSFKNLLTKNGYRVAICTTGEEAISRVQEKEFDIIFIDMILPTINGLETYLAIKKINPEVVAIMVTGYRQEMDGLIQQALNNNAYGCFYKPLDINEVLRFIEEIDKRKIKQDR